MAKHNDVLIIGGGVIGLSLAYYMQKDGLKITLCDQAALGQEASWAGAGMIPGYQAKAASTPIGQLRGLAFDEIKHLSKELQSRTGIDNGYLRCGGLELRCNATALEKKRLDQLQRDDGIDGQNGEILDQAGLRQLEPHLSTTLPGGLLYRDAAQVRNPRHLKALSVACTSMGACLRPFCPVYAINHAHGRITGVHTSAGVLQADVVVIAAGAWSKPFLMQLGYDVDIQPVRGQIAMLKCQFPLFQRMLLAGPKYLVPRPDGRVLVGSTEEHVGFCKTTTAAAIQQLLQMAIDFVPALAEAELEKCWAGLRPGSPDKKPILGKVPAIDNLYIASGHFRSGLQLSAITGKLLTDLIMQRPMAMDISPFSIQRFMNATATS